MRLLKKLQKWSGNHGYTCDVCGEEVYDYPHTRVCATCLSKIERNDKRICPKCGRKTVAEGICLTCKSHLPVFDEGVSPLVYRAETASLVNRIKNGNQRLAFFFGEQMAAEFLTRFADSLSAWATPETPLLVVPVPLTKTKRKRRGYNQAEILADVVTNCLQKAGVAVVQDNDVLQKTRDEEQQKHLDVAGRIENAQGAYHLHKRALCRGKTVLLIDDVLTTGATGSACAKHIQNAGATRVLLLTVAALQEQK